MSDIFPVKEAAGLGYTVFWNDNHAWFSHIDKARAYVSGPFKTIEDAAYAALSDYENVLAVEREKETWDVETYRNQD